MILREHLYTKRYATKEKDKITQLLGGELLIELPAMPQEKFMRNYGLKTKDQKFKTESLPENFSILPYEIQLKYATDLYHLRHNGEWWLIKGEPVYVSGHAWFFFNFWVLPEGKLPTFRMEAVDFYNAWEFAMYDDDCFGLVIIKGRQEGGTQKVSCGLYDDATRYNNVLIGMMSYDETIVKASFKKIVSGHNAMHEVFKPRTIGANKVVKELAFTLPASHQAFEETESKQWKGLESFINYRPNTLGQYDGENRMLWFFYDEFAKIHELNPYDQLNVMKPLLSEMNGLKIKGKAILLSTVEDRKRANESKSRSIAYTETIWRDSLQVQKNERGRTKSGLYRYFRDCLHSAEVDEWGFHKKDEMKRFIEAEIKMYSKDKDWHNLSSFRRKYPLTITDALQVSAASCVMFPHLLEQQRAKIVTNKDNDNGAPKAIRGELVWTPNTHLEVTFIPNDTGRWLISQRPEEPNAKMTTHGIASPKNGVYYSFGVDPIDGNTAVSSPSQLSKLGFTVFRKFNPFIDNEANGVYMDSDENGNLKCINPEKMQTNRFVCTYLYRDDSPDECFQSVLKTAIYYGVPAFIEKNRAYIFNLMERDYRNYLAFRPKESLSTSATSKAALQRGITATVYTKELLTSRLQAYVYSWFELIEHLDLIENLRGYTGSNLTDCDLVAGAGYALIQSDDLRYNIDKQNKIGVWGDSLFQKYPK